MPEDKKVCGTCGGSMEGVTPGNLCRVCGAPYEGKVVVEDALLGDLAEAPDYARRQLAERREYLEQRIAESEQSVAEVSAKCELLEKENASYRAHIDDQRKEIETLRKQIAAPDAVSAEELLRRGGGEEPAPPG